MKRLLKWLNIKEPFPLNSVEYHKYWAPKLNRGCHNKPFLSYSFDWDDRAWKCNVCGLRYHQWMADLMWEKEQRIQKLAKAVGKAAREGRIAMKGDKPMTTRDEVARAIGCAQSRLDNARGDLEVARKKLNQFANDVEEHQSKRAIQRDCAHMDEWMEFAFSEFSGGGLRRAFMKCSHCNQMWCLDMVRR